MLMRFLNHPQQQTQVWARYRPEVHIQKPSITLWARPQNLGLAEYVA